MQRVLQTVRELDEEEMTGVGVEAMVRFLGQVGKYGFD